MRRTEGQPTTRRRVWVGAPVTVAALVSSVTAVALVTAGSALGSNDPCTQTLSNAGTSIGSSGRNVMCGTSGSDTLEGRGGNDELRGFGGNDELWGESGNDDLFGGSGGDTLVGGDGGDNLFMRDGELDAFACNSGTDFASIDLVDAGLAFSANLSATLRCEDVAVGAVNEGPNVVISGRSLRVGRDGRTRIRLGCPRSLPIRCSGRLELQLRSSRLARRKALRTRYSIAPGQSRQIRVRLARRDQRTLRRRRSASGVATSVETGQHGRKTTLETIRLRARR